MSAVEMKILRRLILRGLCYGSLGVALIATPASPAAARERMSPRAQAQSQAPAAEDADDFAQDAQQSQADRDQEKRDQEQEKRDREQEKRDREQEKRDHEQEVRDRDQELYENGREALDEDHYDRAASSFGELAKRNGPQTDAALYWEAYAQNRQGKRDAALATLAELKHRFPQSRWQKDASALEIEVRQRSGQAPRPDSESDEDLKMLAIQGLMNSAPDRALPLLEKVLNGAGTPKEKSKALFVIAQSGSPEAKQILGRIASGQSNPDLQHKAVEYLGMFGGDDSHKILADVYAKSSDESLKRAILRSYMISGDKEDLFNAAKSEKSESVRGEAIRQLGLVHGVDQLQQLYQREPSTAVKRDILQAFFLAGDSTRLVQAATSEKDPELRRTAVRNLGLINSTDSAQALKTIYVKDSDESVRREVLNAYFIQGNAAALVAIARAEKNPELKREAVSKLSLMQSKEATDYLMEILQK
jgi:hypothetical protein